MNKTLLYFDSSYVDISLDLLAAAEKIDNEVETYALCINHKAADLAKISKEFDYIIKIDDIRLDCCDAANITNAMEEVQQVHNFDTILLPTTMNGMAIAPRIAMRLNTGLTADVTDVADGQLIRPAFDGKILAGIVNEEGARPLMATIRTGAFEYSLQMAKNAHIIEHVFNNYIDSGLQLIETREKPPSKDIRTSRVLIAGGGGIAKDFYKLEDLAKALNGQVAASRRIVDAALARRKIQVGQSGKTVSPDLYIAFGIHGALQHVEGLKNVKHLIVVNTDKYAPIRYMANIIVEGDATTFLELLIGRIMPLK